jgi:hypothetical protein
VARQLASERFRELGTDNRGLSARLRLPQAKVRLSHQFPLLGLI